jgi:hypothetical protein
MRNDTGDLVILIGDESPAKMEAPWSDYFSIYEWTQGKFVNANFGDIVERFNPN